MGTKHTPGPWKATPILQDTGDFCIHAAGIPWQLAYLAESRQIEWPIEANARLISAAPDMLEALADCVSVLTDPVVGTVRHDDPDWYWALDKAVAKARAAISKATGE